MTIRLSNYNSPFFPVLACWAVGAVEYSAVYTSCEEAINHLSGRFGVVVVEEVQK